MYGINNPIITDLVDAIEMDKIGYLSTLDDATFCGHCLIKKPAKTRHCPNTNLCLPKFHFYSTFFDKPVYFANELFYYLIQILQICL